MRYNLDLDDAADAVRRFNQRIDLAAAEYMVAREFPPKLAPFTRLDVATRVVLLDGLWATQSFWESGAVEYIVNNLHTHAAGIHAELSSLAADDLEANWEKVDGVARTLLAYFFGRDPDRRQNYSLASKFYHWTTRSHLPIVDSRARRAVNEFQEAHGASRAVRIPRNMTRPYAADYSRWVRFYHELIVGLDENARIRLIKADQETQISGFRVENSLLRMLDKVFFIKGERRR